MLSSVETLRAIGRSTRDEENMTSQREQTLQQINEREPLTGNLIESLIDIVENVERRQPQFDADDDIELERMTRLTIEPLTIDEVMAGTQIRAWYELQAALAAKWM